jgi:hypothetical protein
LSGPPATVAVKLAESPGSIVSLAGPVTVTPVGLLLLLLPHPVRVAARDSRRREAVRGRALRKTRWSVGVCFPGRVRKAGLD